MIGQTEAVPYLEKRKEEVSKLRKAENLFILLSEVLAPELTCQPRLLSILIKVENGNRFLPQRVCFWKLIAVVI